MKRIKGAVLAIGLGLALSAPAWAQSMAPRTVAGTADAQSAVRWPTDPPQWCPDPYHMFNAYYRCLFGEKTDCQYVNHHVADLRACVRRVYRGNGE